MRLSRCLYTSNPFVTECLARSSEEERKAWHERAYGVKNGRLHLKVDVERIYMTQGAPALDGDFAKAVHRFISFQGSDAAERHSNEQDVLNLRLTTRSDTEPILQAYKHLALLMRKRLYQQASKLLIYLSIESTNCLFLPSHGLKSLVKQDLMLKGTLSQKFSAQQLQKMRHSKQFARKVKFLTTMHKYCQQFLDTFDALD